MATRSTTTKGAASPDQRTVLVNEGIGHVVSYVGTMLGSPIVTLMQSLAVVICNLRGLLNPVDLNGLKSATRDSVDRLWGEGEDTTLMDAIHKANPEITAEEAVKVIKHLRRNVRNYVQDEVKRRVRDPENFPAWEKAWAVANKAKGRPENADPDAIETEAAQTRAEKASAKAKRVSAVIGDQGGQNTAAKAARSAVGRLAVQLTAKSPTASSDPFLGALEVARLSLATAGDLVNEVIPANVSLGRSTLDTLASQVNTLRKQYDSKHPQVGTPAEAETVSAQETPTTPAPTAAIDPAAQVTAMLQAGTIDAATAVSMLQAIQTTAQTAAV